MYLHNDNKIIMCKEVRYWYTDKTSNTRISSAVQITLSFKQGTENTSSHRWYFTFENRDNFISMGWIWSVHTPWSVCTYI